MDHYQLLKEKADEIIRLGEKHGANNLRIFGSVARKDYRNNSDFDFLYTRALKCSPWFPASLKVDLEELLKHPVDLVSEKYIKDRMRDKILTEAIPLCDLMKKD